MGNVNTQYSFLPQSEAQREFNNAKTTYKKILWLRKYYPDNEFREKVLGLLEECAYVERWEYKNMGDGTVEVYVKPQTDPKRWPTYYIFYFDEL